MRKTQVMSVREFLNSDHETPPKRMHIAYKIIGSLIIITITGGLDFASPALAATAIDEAGRNIYYKLVNVGKWIIIFKGGIETIKAISDGNIDGAKRNFFGYTIAYLLLLALPWCFDTVDDVFKELG